MNTSKFKVEIDNMLSLYEIDEEKSEKLEDKIKNKIGLITLPYLFEDLQKGYEYGDFSNLEDNENPYKIIESFQSQLNNIESL